MKEVKCLLQRRLPKFGFNNIRKKEYVCFNLYQLQSLIKKDLIGKEISHDVLYNLKLVKKKSLIKILSGGLEIEESLVFIVNACSAKAKEMIESKGGKVVIL